jgi:hypothetical protein
MCYPLTKKAEVDRSRTRGEIRRERGKKKRRIMTLTMPINNKNEEKLDDFF